MTTLAIYTGRYRAQLISSGLIIITHGMEQHKQLVKQNVGEQLVFHHGKPHGSCR